MTASQQQQLGCIDLCLRGSFHGVTILTDVSANDAQNDAKVVKA
eukprot:CAMPEP_0172462114 /NCGR_PEP_ID=MMETSP1065-20121228/42821_1 /TAXON_ID=265537 /ORGANISM="Amphiprora paludosa, Strain CCMP125" /LENGTH=43 /DNA_ID= /DNA_START= /DNA_END= /DNA_ORIENTATION=